jgi:hypothetical protein
MREAVLWTGMVCLLAVGCGGHGAPRARHQILTEDAPRAASIIRDLATRDIVALQRAADRFALGFVRVEGARRVSDMHHALWLLRSPRGIPALADPAVAFIAAIDADGRWLASDRDVAPGVNTNFATQWPAVAAALRGQDASTGLAELPSSMASSGGALHWILAQPARDAGKVVGAFVLDVPAPELLRLTRSSAKSAGVVLYHGEHLYNPDPPLALDLHVVPDAAQRKAGLARSPGGFTAEVSRNEGSYAYGVRPLPLLGPDVGIVIVRKEVKD